MSKRKNKINKKTLLTLAESQLEEEFAPIESTSDSNISENNEIEIKKENYKQIEPLYNKVRDKGDWEFDISEVTPLKKVECVGLFKKLSNGLTPYELMYGKQDNDFAYNFD